jgi:hypothetical protein
MRSPKAFRFTQRVIPLAVLLLAGLLSLSARAQYAGGPGDGYAVAGTQFVTLDGHFITSPAYTASASGGDGYSSSGRPNVKLDGILPPDQPFTASANGGDGYSVSGKAFIPVDGVTLPAPIFTASASGGDGYAFSRLANFAVDGTLALVAVFRGGAGDGYDVQGFESRPVDPNALVDVIYSGGAGDGYDKSGRQFIPLGGSDEGLAVIYTASGSGGDGYDSAGTLFQSLDGNTSPSVLFVSSGTGDGYDFARASFVPVNGEPSFVLSYLGDAGDGYSKAGAQFVQFNGLVLAEEPFIGGAGDGYDRMELPFVQYLGGGEAAAGITFTGWRNSRFTEEEINAGLADPNEDADQDGLVNLMEFALGSDPRVPDAFLFSPEYRLTNLSDLGLPALPDHYLTAIVRRNPLALDATLRIEITDDPAGFWGSNETIQVDASPSVLIIRDELGVSTSPRRIMRLRATLNP